MKTKSESAPISAGRQEEIENECVHSGVEFCGCCKAVALVYSRERGCGVCLRHKWEQDNGPIEFPHGSFPADPARIAAYVNAKVREALEEFGQMEISALEKLKETWTNHLVGQPPTGATKLRNRIKGLASSIDCIRALVAGRVKP